MTNGTAFKLDDASKEDLRILFQTTVSDIQFFKSKQWNTTNYAVLTYVALVAGAGYARSFGHCLSPMEKAVAIFLTFTTMVIALCTIDSLNTSLKNSRKVIEQISRRLSLAFQESRKTKWNEAKKEGRDLPFPCAFYYYVVLGAVIAAWILFQWF